MRPRIRNTSEQGGLRLCGKEPALEKWTCGWDVASSIYSALLFTSLQCPRAMVGVGG